MFCIITVMGITISKSFSSFAIAVTRKAKPGATVAHTSISAPPCMGCQSIAELPPALFGRYPHLGGEKHCETIVLPKSNAITLMTLVDYNPVKSKLM